jgi:hypothetical protein
MKISRFIVAIIVLWEAFLNYNALAQDVSSTQIGRYQLFQGFYVQKTRTSFIDSTGAILTQQDKNDTVCTIFKIDTITGDVFPFASWFDEQMVMDSTGNSYYLHKHRFSEGWLKTGSFQMVTDTVYAK